MTKVEGEANDVVPKRGMTSNRRRGLIIFLAISYAVMIPMGVALLLYINRPVSHGVEAFASAFSDIVSPIFSVLAFGGLVVTALMQREELSLQREDLQENREELKRTADAQAALVETAQLSARITAMTTLMSFYQSRSSDAYGGVIANEARRKVPEIARDIESLLVEEKNQRTPKG